MGLLDVLFHHSSFQCPHNIFHPNDARRIIVHRSVICRIVAHGLECEPVTRPQQADDAADNRDNDRQRNPVEEELTEIAAGRE